MTESANAQSTCGPGTYSCLVQARQNSIVQSFIWASTLAVEQNTLASTYIPVNERKLVPEQHTCASIQSSTGITGSLMAGGLPNSWSSPKKPLLAGDGELLRLCAALTV